MRTVLSEGHRNPDFDRRGMAVGLAHVWDQMVP
jgi:c-di-AMP phosphodiesterase-like protein